MPNETRVSGCQLLLQGLIRNKWVMDDFYNSSFYENADFKKQYPKERDWEILSHVEGVLFPLQRTSMSMQTDDPGSGSAAMLQFLLSYRETQKMKLKGVQIVSLVRSDYASFEGRNC